MTDARRRDIIDVLSKKNWIDVSSNRRRIKTFPDNEVVDCRFLNLYMLSLASCIWSAKSCYVSVISSDLSTSRANSAWILWLTYMCILEIWQMYILLSSRLQLSEVCSNVCSQHYVKCPLQYFIYERALYYHLGSDFCKRMFCSINWSKLHSVTWKVLCIFI